MHQQGGGAVEVDAFVIAEQPGPGFAGKALADQEIAVAGLEADLGAVPGQAGQRLPDGVERPGAVVVADVGIEQVAEDVEPLGAPGAAAAQGQETLDRLRPVGREVQVGDEQRFRAHAGRRKSAITWRRRCWPS